MGRTSAELDVRDREAVFAFFSDRTPRHVVMAAPRLGGIQPNSTQPVELLRHPRI